MLMSGSVIALSKLFTLNDPRVVQTMVKGDLIVPTSNRIMTRSQAKLSRFPRNTIGTSLTSHSQTPINTLLSQPP
jgi:hypothetical protein